MEDRNNLPHTQVYSPHNLSELFSFWSRFQDSVLYAGGTDLLRGQTKRLFQLPKNIISLEKMEELRKINRTERYLEIGSVVCLSDILRLGKIVPESLGTIIKSIGNPRLRNLATIGGAILSTHRFSDLHAALIVLDAQYEYRSATNAHWVSASRFVISENELLSSEKALISRIRIPLSHWDYLFHKKMGHPHRDDPGGGTFILLCNRQKTIITELHYIFTGQTIIRFKDIETNLIGQNIPLSDKTIESVLEQCLDILVEKIPDHRYLQNNIIRSIKAALSSLL